MSMEQLRRKCSSKFCLLLLILPIAACMTSVFLQVQASNPEKVKEMGLDSVNASSLGTGTLTAGATNKRGDDPSNNAIIGASPQELNTTSSNNEGAGAELGSSDFDSNDILELMKALFEGPSSLNGSVSGQSSDEGSTPVKSEIPAPVQDFKTDPALIQDSTIIPAPSDNATTTTKNSSFTSVLLEKLLESLSLSPVTQDESEQGASSHNATEVKETPLNVSSSLNLNQATTPESEQPEAKHKFIPSKYTARTTVSPATTASLPQEEKSPNNGTHLNDKESVTVATTATPAYKKKFTPSSRTVPPRFTIFGTTPEPTTTPATSITLSSLIEDFENEIESHPTESPELILNPESRNLNQVLAQEPSVIIDDQGHHIESATNATPTPSEISCPHGKIKSWTGKCGKGYLESCSTSDPCIQGLFCRKDTTTNSNSNNNNKKNKETTKEKPQPLRCTCLLKDQVYSESLRQCMSRVGGPCGEDMPCFGNAKCSAYSAQISGICNCPEGSTVENESGGCDLTHGQTCSSTLGECDSIAGLICVHGKCQCPGFGQYSLKERTCRGLVGARCDFNEEENSHPCVEHASCVKPHAKLDAKYCECEKRYERTENFTCKEKAVVGAAGAGSSAPSYHHRA